MKYLPFVLVSCFICLGSTLRSQSYTEQIQQYQDTLNAEYANPNKSPLKPEDLETFAGLDFFPINKKYKVTAKLVRTPHSKPFKMKMTTARVAIYSKYADVVFELDGIEYLLQVYQNHDLMKMDEYKDYLFLPFLDDTNGETSYGGGRYVSLRIPEGDEMEIDFNKAYNPYCAYNDRYSCPIVPRKNRLKTNLKAGVMAFEKD